MKPLEFPQAKNLDQFFSAYSFGEIDPGKMNKPSGMVWIDTNRQIKGELLYGTPTLELSNWIANVFEPVRFGYVRLIEREDEVLVLWQAHKIIASRHLALLPKGCLAAIPY